MASPNPGRTAPALPALRDRRQGEMPIGGVDRTILHRFEETGIEFAFPTRTTVLECDAPHEGER